MFAQPTMSTRSGGPTAGPWRPLSIIAVIAALVLVLSSCGSLFSRGSENRVEPEKSDSAETNAKTGETAAAKVKPKPTAVILDASGSMTAEDAPGQRFAAAQKAVNGLVETIPDGQETSLITYGTTTGNSDAEKAEGCQDVSTVIDSAPIDKEAFTSAVDDLEPSGFTPIALALQTAAEQLPDSGDRAIVLLSDGIDTCTDEGDQLDPCATAQDLGTDGGLAIHTVGFRVDGQASKQLECLSGATNGTSWDAVNDKQLGTRLAMAINPELAKTLLSPSGYKGLEPGMSADEVKKIGGITDDISDQGRVEIIYVDCVLVFVDGVLEEISTDGVPTLDGIKPGDDISDAEAIYGDPERPTEISDDGAAIYSADPVEGTGFKFYFEGSGDYQAGQELSGAITKMVLCKCITTDSSSAADPPVASDGTTASPHGTTRLRTFSPFESDGEIRNTVSVDDMTDLPPLPAISQPSLSGVAPGTYWLGATADSASACWRHPEEESQVICLRNPWSDETFTRSVEQSLPDSDASSDPVLWALELEDGSRWQVRIGGSWGARQDDWNGMYQCIEKCTATGDTDLVILANDDYPHGYDDSSKQWVAFVGQIGNSGQSFPAPEKVGITEGWYVG